MIYVLVSLLACGLAVLLRLNSITSMSLTSIAIGVLLMVGGRIAENGSAPISRPVQSTERRVQPFAPALRRQFERLLRHPVLSVPSPKAHRDDHNPH
jgi:multisubunit Na+/H+ antiporter MnhC subunit